MLMAYLSLRKDNTKSLNFYFIIIIQRSKRKVGIEHQKKKLLWQISMGNV